MVAMYSLAMVAALVGGVVGAGAASLAWNGSIDSEATVVTEPGDAVELYLTFFDQAGRILASNDERYWMEMNSTAANYTGRYVVPASFGAFKHIASHESRPIFFGENVSLPIGSLLIGKALGDRIPILVVGEYTGFQERIEWPRARGPYNFTMTLPTSALANLSVSEDSGEVVFENVLRGRILAQDAESLTVALKVSDGDALPVRVLGLTARVHMIPGTNQFMLLMETEPGHEFSVMAACSVAQSQFMIGSYRVRELTGETIIFERSPTRFPQLIEKPLSLSFEVASITRGVSSPIPTGGNET